MKAQVVSRNPFVVVLIYFISTFLGSELGASSWLCSDADRGSTESWLPPLCCPQPTLRFGSGRIMSKSPSPTAVQWEKARCPPRSRRHEHSERSLPGAPGPQLSSVGRRAPPPLCLVTQTLLSIIHFLPPGQELVQPRADQPVQTSWESLRPAANSGLTFLCTTSRHLFTAFIPHTTPTGGFLFITCLLKKQGLRGYNPSSCAIPALVLPVSE